MTATAAPTNVGGLYETVRGYSRGGITCVPGTITMSGSYTTGGDPVTLPKGRGMKLRGIQLLVRYDGTRLYEWNGSITAPTIKAWSALGTEVTAATSLSAVQLPAIFWFDGP